MGDVPEGTEHFMKSSKKIEVVLAIAASIMACSAVSSFAGAGAKANSGFLLAPKAMAVLGNGGDSETQDAPANNASDKSGLNSSDPDYVIGTQDLLAINVWHEPELSRSVPVRPDGKISMPLVGDLEVRGLTPRLLQIRLVKELEAYIRKPQVTVIVEEANSHKFFVMGEVQRPGVYPLTTNITVLDALATAGGFKDFAKVNKIVVLRTMADGSRQRIPFQYKQAIKGGKSALPLQLMPGDTVIVP